MNVGLPFRDRSEGGRVLARVLGPRTGSLILGLPRGGVPVAAEVASALDLPLDVFLVRKLGVPGQEELAFGAIASGGVRVLNHNLLAEIRMPEHLITRVTERETAELERRAQEYRGNAPPPPVRGRAAILVDDGLATGASMVAAVRALRQLAPQRIVVAVPVGSVQACKYLGTEADEVVCAATPEHFRAVGEWYEDFRPTTDEQVRELLRRTSWKES